MAPRLATAVWDPGVIVKRGDNYNEHLANWQTRAVQKVVADHLDALNLHEETGDPRDLGYMAALADVRESLLGESGDR